MNREPLRVLNLEADAGDHERIRSAISSAGIELILERASNREEFEAALGRGKVDLVLADYSVPGFGGPAALEATRRLLPGVPFVIVSGSVGEEAAVESVRRGCADFVHKDRLERLPGVVRGIMGGACAPAGVRAAQPDLLQDQKMELVGKLAGGMAHDFNNLLTIISGYVSMLIDKEDLPPASSEALKRVFTASRQATGLVRQLMLFSRKREPMREVVDLNTEVEIMVGMLRRLLGETVVLGFEAAPEQPRCSVDIGMLEQAVVNVAVNARDAMPRGGRLDIRVGISGKGGGPAPGPPPQGEFAFISMRDTGCGIPEAALPRIFEPFFTTKGEGRGTGLGLATARDIMQRHGGWIEVETKVGAGTAFRLVLPLTRAEIEAPRVPEPGKGGKARKATILLVEDEANVREFAAAVLQQDGYTLLQAKSGESALEVWRWHSARIDLLLADVVLPGELSGPQLGERFTAEKPSLKVILTTGYNRETVAGMSAGGMDRHVLNKPYTPRILLQAVRAVLGPSA